MLREAVIPMTSTFDGTSYFVTLFDHGNCWSFVTFLMDKTQSIVLKPTQSGGTSKYSNQNQFHLQNCWKLFSIIGFCNPFWNVNSAIIEKIKLSHHFFKNKIVIKFIIMLRLMTFNNNENDRKQIIDFQINETCCNENRTFLVYK